MRDNGERLDQALAEALRDLAGSAAVPPVDPSREAALMAAFDAARIERAPAAKGRQYWGMAALAAAAAVLIVVALHPPVPGIRGARGGGQSARVESPVRQASEPQPPNEFVIVPGAAALPAMESGSLVRMDLPVSMLPSLGLTPPGVGRPMVKADLVIGQDGLTRAVRLVD